MFQGLFDSDITNVISISDFLLCLLCALFVGLLLCFTYMFRSRCSKSFVVTLALLPAIVCILIMMVNGNVGTGVAVAGVFSLVRFRSLPGTAKEICMLFLAMSCGLITGMGYLAYAILFTILMCMMFLLYHCFDFHITKKNATYKLLTIMIPEDLNHSDVFNDIFQQYTSSYQLVRIKTTNMGSMYKLSYEIVLRSLHQEREMIDAIRCRNGNLEISISNLEGLNEL